MIHNWTIVETTAAGMKARNKDWRPGQCYFNALYTLDPETANQIRATLDDPFDDDSKIENFTKKVLEIWSTQNT